MSGRRIILLIAFAVAVIAAAGVALYSQTWVSQRRLFNEPDLPLVVTSFGACGRVDEPPACLVEKAAPYSASNDRGLLYTAITAGAVDSARARRALFVDAAQGRGTTNQLFEAGVSKQRYPSREQLLDALEPVVAAAIILAAAAQVSDDPFAHPIAVGALAEAGDTAAVAQIATTLWEEADPMYRWRLEIDRPRGIAAIWRAVAAAPPRDTGLLAELAEKAPYWGARDEAASLAREVLKRDDATAEDRSRIEDAATPTESQARGPAAEALARKEAVELCMRVLTQNGFQAPHCGAYLELLLKAGGTRELMLIGDAYLERARKSRDVSEYRTAWFGLASEAYRLAGERERALVAAREGLPLVALAVIAHWPGGPAPALNTLEERRRAAADIGDGGTQPVIQLYRAGARDEALRTGFLSGYDRFRNADVAGETPDARWVAQDHSSFTVERFLDDLMRKPDVAAARVFHDALLCEGSRFDEFFRKAPLARMLGLSAALAGRRQSMTAHLARAAQQIDEQDQMFYRAQLARDLAEEWRRALTISERSAATTETPGPCAEAR